MSLLKLIIKRQYNTVLIITFWKLSIAEYALVTQKQTLLVHWNIFNLKNVTNVIFYA